MPGWPSKPRRLEAVPGLEPREVALGEHEVVLLHFVDQIAARLAEPQRGPAILRRLEAGREPLRRPIEVRGLLGIAENLVERRAVELVVRQSPADFGGEVVGIQLVVGDVDLLDLATLGEAARLADPQQLAVPIDRAADQARLAAFLVKRRPAAADSPAANRSSSRRGRRRRLRRSSSRTKFAQLALRRLGDVHWRSRDYDGGCARQPASSVGSRLSRLHLSSQLHAQAAARSPCSAHWQSDPPDHRARRRPGSLQAVRSPHGRTPPTARSRSTRGRASSPRRASCRCRRTGRARRRPGCCSRG